MSQPADLLGPAAGDPVVDAAPRTYQFGSRYTHYALAVLLGCGTFNIIDRTVVNLLLVPIGRDLQLSDTQLGLFAGTAFGIFYALAQIPIARFADRKPRGRIISMALAFWSAMTLLQSSVTGFLTLALTRAGVAIGEAGSGPASMSMLADLFPPERRTRAFAILAAQAPIGAAIGALVAGFAREAIGWRGALMLVGVPGLLFAVVVWRTLREPTRGYFQTGPVEPSANMRETLRFLLGLPAFRHTLIAYTILVTVAGAQSFDPVYLERVFGFAPKEVGLIARRRGTAVDRRLLPRRLAVRPHDDARRGLGVATAGDFPDLQPRHRNRAITTHRAARW